MEDLLQQIEKALNYNLYYIALQTTLTLPDICSALISATPENRYVKQDYIDWYSNNFHFDYFLTPEDCYYFRCANVHQAKTTHHRLGYSRILFLEPRVAPIIMNNCILEDALCIDINTFCKDMILSVRNWLDFEIVKNNPVFQKNYASLIKRYPNGISPYIVGTPVIS